MLSVRSVALTDVAPAERRDTRLLWDLDQVRRCSGCMATPSIADGGSYFQSARSTPRPIRLARHAGHGPWDDTARAVLALSKMDWNNDAPYDPLPVTLAYAKVLARVVKRMRGLGSTPYQFRFFM